MSSFGGQNGMNRQNDRTHTERMMAILIALKYPPNRRTFLYSLSPVEGTVDLIYCCSHEEASVLAMDLVVHPIAFDVWETGRFDVRKLQSATPLQICAWANS